MYLKLIKKPTFTSFNVRYNTFGNRRPRENCINVCHGESWIINQQTFCTQLL